MREGYIFHVRVDNNDEFIKVSDNEKIALQIDFPWDCFIFWVSLNMLLMFAGFVYILYFWTKILNQGFNVDSTLPYPFGE